MYKKVFLSSIYFILLVSWFIYHWEQYNKKTWPVSAWGERVIVIGTIITPVEFRQQTALFNFACSQIQIGQNSSQYRGHLRLYFKPFDQQSPRVGEKWQFLVQVKPPRGYLTPGSFNHKLWAMSEDIHGIGSVIESRLNNKLEDPKFYLALKLNQLREHLSTNLDQLLMNSPVKGILKALVIGMRTNITEAQWQILSNTGTNHLVAIAGLHIGFIYSFAYLIGNWLWRRYPSGMLRFPAQQIASITALFFAIGYAALSGFLLPTQRALSMLCVYTFCRLRWQQIKGLRSLMYAFLVVYFLNPLAVLGESFWLSFNALFWIHYAFYGRPAVSPKVKWLILQAALSIGVIPLTLLFFHKFSLISCIANGVAVPIVGFVILPLVLGGSFISFASVSLAKPIIWAAAWSMMKVCLFLEFLGDIPDAVWFFAPHSIEDIVLLALGLIWLFTPRGLPLHYAGLMGCLPILFPFAANIPDKAFYLTTLDVGQGLSIVIQTQHHVLVYDAGPKWPGFDAGTEVVLPFLWHQGIRKIDTLIVSHGDMDHRGGAASIIQQASPNILLTSAPQYFKNFPNTFVCSNGQTWQWDGVLFQIIWPIWLASNRILKNDASCVLKVCAKNHCALLPGDIESNSESKLVESESSKLGADLLIAPHHGSATSSSWQFLEAVKPQFISISVGFENRFDFPNPDVLQRYKALSAQIYRTDKNGAFTFAIKPKGTFFIPIS